MLHMLLHMPHMLLHMLLPSVSIDRVVITIHEKHFIHTFKHSYIHLSVIN